MRYAANNGVAEESHSARQRDREIVMKTKHIWWCGTCDGGAKRKIKSKS